MWWQSFSAGITPVLIVTWSMKSMYAIFMTESLFWTLLSLLAITQHQQKWKWMYNQVSTLDIVLYIFNGKSVFNFYIKKNNTLFALLHASMYFWFFTVVTKKKLSHIAHFWVQICLENIVNTVNTVHLRHNKTQFF